MNIDKNDFFREGTLKICGNLEIEEAMLSTLNFLHRFMPATIMFLERYDDKVTATRTLAKVTLEKGESVDLYTPLSDEAQKFAVSYLNDHSKKVYLINNPWERPLASEMMHFHQISLDSLMLLPLETGGQVVGSLVIGSETGEPFTQEHADLLTLLNEPFAIALSNTLKHRSELKLYDRDFFWEATRRICGSLEIEKALHSCLQFLRQFMPLDRAYLQCGDCDKHTMRTIATATPTEYIALEEITRLSPEVMDCEHKDLPQRYGVYMFDGPDSSAISREMLKFHQVPCTAHMVLPLISGEEIVGHLVCITEGEEKFSDEHARLISMLKEPFTVALSNTLKHRSELKLYDRDFFWGATQRICGSLNIEEALWQCLLFLQEYIPVEEAALAYFDQDTDTITLNTHATSSEGRLVNLQVPYPDEARSTLTDPTVMEDLIDNQAEKNPLARSILDTMKKGKSSLLITRLIVENVWVGSVVLWASGWDRFNEEHLRLLKQLKQPFFIALSNSRRYMELLRLKELLADDNQYLQEELQRIRGEEIVGSDFGLKGVMDKVRSVASLSSPVLLLGETGVGKEVIAGAIHNSSLRRDEPFIKVNCGAIPESLMDSELFGHEKGAFTGALSQKRGRFERAHKGTIFLDEIGELSLEAQVRLLRVLQEKEIERVGGTEPIQVDIRVIAATHRDLNAMIQEGTFREDLYFRLQVFPIDIPPLRERKGDIPSLVQHFIQKKSRELKLATTPPLTPGAHDQLLAYSWPGNVRELENVIERAIILNRDKPLTFTDIGQHEQVEKTSVPAMEFSGSYNLDQVVSDHIRRAMEAANGKVEGKDGAAELLGINPGTLRHRMRKLGIPFGRNNH